jgi:hypothetical protein
VRRLRLFHLRVEKALISAQAAVALQNLEGPIKGKPVHVRSGQCNSLDKEELRLPDALRPAPLLARNGGTGSWPSILWGSMHRQVIDCRQC